MRLTLCFTTSRSWISKAIHWFTRSRVSHVMIGCQYQGMPFFLHASSGGVQLTPRAKYLKSNVVVDEYRILPDVEVGFDHALSHLNEKYDYLTLFGWGAVILLWRWFRIKAKNPLESPTAMVCSEFVCHLDMAHGGMPGKLIPEWEGLDPDKTHCQMLLDRMGPSFQLVCHE